VCVVWVHWYTMLYEQTVRVPAEKETCGQALPAVSHGEHPALGDVDVHSWHRGEVRVHLLVHAQVPNFHPGVVPGRYGSPRHRVPFYS